VAARNPAASRRRSGRPATTVVVRDFAVDESTRSPAMLVIPTVEHIAMRRAGAASDIAGPP
jgi:hypothetical protein